MVGKDILYLIVEKIENDKPFWRISILNNNQ